MVAHRMQQRCTREVYVYSA